MLDLILTFNNGHNDVSPSTLPPLLFLSFVYIYFIPYSVLPSVDADDGKGAPDFAKKANKKMASLMNVDVLKVSKQDIEMWKSGKYVHGLILEYLKLLKN